MGTRGGMGVAKIIIATAKRGNTLQVFWGGQIGGARKVEKKGRRVCRAGPRKISRWLRGFYRRRPGRT